MRMIRLLSIGKQLVNSSTCLLKQVLELAKLELTYCKLFIILQLLYLCNHTPRRYLRQMARCGVVLTSRHI